MKKMLSGRFNLFLRLKVICSLFFVERVKGVTGRQKSETWLSSILSSLETQESSGDIVEKNVY